MKTRREFIKKCCSLGAAGAGLHLTRLGVMNANAQNAAGYKALVCIFLFGGNDGNNTVIPVGGTQPYTDYTRMRGELALPAVSILPLSGNLGVHPRLTAVQRLFNQNRAAVVLNVGTLVRPVTKAQINAGGVQLPRNLYSHSDQTSQWQSSNPTGASATGWGGRINDLFASTTTSTFPQGVSVNGNSLQLVGLTARTVNLSPGSNFGLDTFGSANDARFAAFQQIINFDSGMTMIASANNILGWAIRGAEEINRALGSLPNLATTFPNSGIGEQLQQVAKVIQARSALGINRQIFFCGMGGFDNHSDLLDSQDGLFTDLNAAIDAFSNSLDEMSVSNLVTTFTESEFGRTGNPSNTRGSDHAWGSHHFVLGAAVKKGIYGTFPTLALQGPDDAGDRGLWIPTTSLDQYGAALASWYGVTDGQLATVFPNLANFPAGKLGLML